MTRAERRRASSRSLSKTRLEAFSDGVFAIAATLLILDVVVHPPGTPLAQVLNAWPAYVAYLISFLTIGAAWIAHAALTDRLSRTDPVFLRLNLLVLLTVVFLPFPTRLLAEGVGEQDAERVAGTLYGLTLLAIRLTGMSVDAYARREHLYAGHDDNRDRRDPGDEGGGRAEPGPAEIARRPCGLWHRDARRCGLASSLIGALPPPRDLPGCAVPRGRSMLFTRAPRQ